MSEERMQILEMIAQGKITAEEGWNLIQVLDETADDDNDEYEEEYFDAPEPIGIDPTAPEIDDAPVEPTPDFGNFRHWWFLPFIGTTLGTGVFVLLLISATQANWAGFWIFCIWNLVILGVALILLSLTSRTARWLHVRVNTGQDEWPRRIAISLPLPLGFLSTIVKLSRPFIPGIKEMNIPIEEMVLALKKSATPQNPLYVEVDEGPGNEKVRVYIG